MLRLNLPSQEFYIEKTGEFQYVEGQTIELEHSLFSISKWESKWNKSFLSSSSLTKEETIDYIRCMTLTKDVNPLLYAGIGNDHMELINNYIQAPMTATVINRRNQPAPSRKTITSEVIYYWMISCGIPFECQYWHINRLLTLIEVCSAENSPKKKMSKKDIYAQNRALNEARRKAYNTRG